MAVVNYRRLLDLLTDPLIVIDELGEIVYSNATAAESFGWDRDELEGQHSSLIFPNGVGSTGLTARKDANAESPSSVDEIATMVAALRRGGEEFDIEVRRKRLPGIGEHEADLIAVILGRSGPVHFDDPDSKPSLVRGLRATAESIAQSGARRDRESWLDLVADTLVRDFGAARARIWIRSDKAKETFDLAAVAGPAEEPCDQTGVIGTTRLSWTRERLDDLVQWGSIQVRDLSSDLSVHPDWIKAHRIVSIFALPLLASGELVGILELAVRQELSDDISTALSAFGAIVAASLSDMEHRELAQAARLEAEMRHQTLRAILEVLPVGVIVVEAPSGQTTLVNTAAVEISIGNRSLEGLTSLEDIDKAVPIYHLDGRRCALKDRPLYRTMHRGELVRETLLCHDPDGRDLLLDVATAPFPGPPAGAVSVYRDVTEEHRLRTELAERAAQFKALLDHLPVGVAYFDDKRTCRAANGPARKLMGRTRSSLQGVMADELFAGKPELITGLTRSLLDHIPHIETSIPWTEEAGSVGIRYLDWRFEPLPVIPNRSAGALALVVDVTERKLAADELRRAAEAAEQASYYKTRFLTAVSHDLRTPVNALSLQSEWLGVVADRQHDPDPDLRPLAADFRKATSNLIELVNDLLELTLFDSGVLEYQPTDFNLDEWLDSTLSPLRLQARSRGLSLTWHVDRPGRVIHGDRIKLARVLLNLVGNAVKFTESGGVQVNAGATSTGEFQLSVRDTGPGIPTDQIDRIFDEFAQLRNPERDRTKGTGLGLAICKRLVAGAGGHLLVESHVGLGSLFTAVYPPDHLLEAREENDGPQSAHVIPTGPTNQSSGTILIVEDDPYSRKSLLKLLERSGFRVESAVSGPQALEIVEQRPPSLILLDLMLPGMDGAEVLRQVRARADREALPVIVISGDVLSGRSTELTALDVNCILAKPIDLDELQRVIREWVQPAVR